MKIAFGCDHGGFPLKSELLKVLKDDGHEVLDCGAFDDKPSDYPDFAKKVAVAVAEGKAERGLIVCGSGVGAAIAANKVPGVRAGLCHDTYSAHQGVEHDDMNVICFGARIIGPALAIELLRSFVAARFEGSVDRYVRRLDKVKKIEKEYSK
jgi:ribose 5-phosphate isomerase B